MGKQHTWLPKRKASFSPSPLPSPFHLLPLLFAGVIIGVFLVALSHIQIHASTSSPHPLTYIPIPKENIAFASTQGAPIEEHPQPIHSYPTYIPTTPPTTSTSTLDAATIFQMVNSIREQNGLPPFQEDSRLCSLATSRAPEVPQEIATGTMHQGMYARNLPYWNSENIIAINSDSAAVTWWMNDAIHRAAILGNATYSCVACSGNSCAEEFSSFQPK